MGSDLIVGGLDRGLAMIVFAPGGDDTDGGAGGGVEFAKETAAAVVDGEGG